MKKETFKIEIDALRETVWDVLWSKETYLDWTRSFSENSVMPDTDWAQGSKVIFGDAKGDGMVSTIETNNAPQFMSIKHLGIVQDGKEDFESEEAKQWAGAYENYTLNAADGKTELVIDIDLVDEYRDYFLDAWPKALARVKELAELQK